MKGIYIFLADGFEETEAFATLDMLRRAELPVKTVSTQYDKFVVGAHKVPVVADMVFGEFKANLELEGTDEGDIMIFPGGLPGAQSLADNKDLMSLAKLHWMEGGAIAAICAAPGLVVSQLPHLEGRKFTCYAGFEKNLLDKGAVHCNAPAVVDGNLITGRGPGCAIEFGLSIVGYLCGEEVQEQVRAGLLI